METRRLQYFLNIADAGSISKAAAACGLAQPALSRQLAILESELKTQLVERSATGVKLTAAGQTLYARAQIIVREVSSLRLDVSGGCESPTGVVAVGVAPSHERFLGLPLLAEVLSRFPKLQLEIVTSGALASQVQIGLLDIAMVPGESFDPSIDATPLLYEDMLLVAPAGASGPPADLASLAAMPWIVTRAQSAKRGVLGQLFGGEGLEPNIVAHIGSLPLVLEAVRRGMGVTLLPRPVIAEAMARGEVSAWRVGRPPLRRTVSLCRRRGRNLSRAAGAVLGLIHQLVAEKVGVGGGHLAQPAACGARRASA
jgi:LysR family nitrogen assimilation transcriptional regulator